MPNLDLRYLQLVLIPLALTGCASDSEQRVETSAAASCQDVDTNVTDQRKSEYAQLIADSLNQNVNPSQVEITRFMQSGTWTVVYADVPVADPGYFFFDSSTGSPVFKDVWGGVAEESEAPEIAKWARDLGANQTIASCFANTVAVAE